MVKLAAGEVNLFALNYQKEDSTESLQSERSEELAPLAAQQT